MKCLELLDKEIVLNKEKTNLLVFNTNNITI